MFFCKINNKDLLKKKHKENKDLLYNGITGNNLKANK